MSLPVPVTPLPEHGFGYGVIGCGWVSPSHAVGARALAGEGVRLVAVADADLERARELAERFGSPDVHGDYLELLARDDVDAVSICLPDHLHRDAAVAAAEAGKHVLCEKPLALDLPEAAEMVEAFDERGLNLSMVMNHRFVPDNMRVQRAVHDGAIGRILMAGVLHSSALTGNDDYSSPWRGRRGRAAGGILATQAIHFLDLLLWFAGPVAAVKAWTETLVRTELDYEDTVAVALKLASGALAIPSPQLRKALAAIALVAGAARSIARVPAWHDDETHYQALKQEAPRSYRTLWLEGKDEFAAERWGSGERLLLQSIAFAPNLTGPRYDLARFYMSAKLWQPAIGQLQVAIALDSAFEPAHQALREALQATSDTARRVCPPP